jgi:hypothetical protein
MVVGLSEGRSAMIDQRSSIFRPKANANQPPGTLAPGEIWLYSQLTISAAIRA